MADRPKSAAIAKWGAACAPCASSKAKCMRTNESSGGKCDRCERLEKDCSEQVHKPRKKRQNKPSKTAELEHKLNSLVDLLRASNSKELPEGLRNPPSISDDPFCIPSETEPLQQSSLTSDRTTLSPASHIETANFVPATYNCHAPPTCICRAPVGESTVALESDETLLSVYVTKLCPEYPFVVLRPGISAQELRTTKPVLFAAIRMVSSVRYMKSLTAQCYPLMNHIAEHMLLRSERSVELLQAILLMLGFYHYQCMLHAQMSNLTALAKSLVGDLSLNVAPELHERTRVLVLNPQPPRPRTNDEKRALVGVWYISSVASLAFQKLDPPSFTSYMDQCLRELEASKEYETDALLVQLVRTQRLSDRISQLQNKDRLDENLPGIPHAPLNAYRTAFQAEIDKFTAQIPRRLRTHRLLMMHVNSAILRLWEPPIVDARLLETLSDSFTSISFSGPSTLDIFYRSNAALKTWFEHWLAVEVSDYYYFPMPAFSQLIISVMMLSRWAKLAGANQPDPTSAQKDGPNSSGLMHSHGTTEGIRDPSEMPRRSSTVPGSSSSPSSAAVSPPGDISQETELEVRHAVARIKEQIRSHPDLDIDIVGILRALALRFEEARSEVGQVYGGVWDNNIWDLAARKISITKLKLERWAEIVSNLGGDGVLMGKWEAGEGPLPPSERDIPQSSASAAQDELSSLQQAPMEGVEQSETTTFNWAPTGQGQDGIGWQNSNVFAHDLFDGLGLDQNFFFDEGGDYGTAVLNNMSFN